MAIKAIHREPVGQVGVVPARVNIDTDDTLFEILADNYLAGAIDMGEVFKPSDEVHVNYADDKLMICNVVINGDDIRLTPVDFEPTIVIPGSQQNLVPNAAYLTTSLVQVALPLPANSEVGDEIEVVALDAAGWRIQQGAGQQIVGSSGSTTVGVAGNINTVTNYSGIRIKCTVANLTWVVIREQGTLVYV